MTFVLLLLDSCGRLSIYILILCVTYYFDAVDRWFVERTTASPGEGVPTIVAPPPMLTPLKLRDLTVLNRVVLSSPPTYSVEDGTPKDLHLTQLSRRALGGAGLVMTEPVSVSPEGRITPDCAGMYRADH